VARPLGRIRTHYYVSPVLSKYENSVTKMNYKSKKDLKIASINLKEDFDMVISFIRTTKDLEVVSKAITKAFQCVPNAQELPSVANEAEENQKAVMKKFEDFLGELQ
tara:strand:- start:47 stop:367 length:321 start_codon:yes stop_codon:yes gene_type:complete